MGKVRKALLSKGIVAVIAMTVAMNSAAPVYADEIEAKASADASETAKEQQTFSKEDKEERPADEMANAVHDEPMAENSVGSPAENIEGAPVEQAEELAEESAIAESASNASAGAASDSTGSTEGKYIVSYLNAEGLIEYTRTYENGETVDLSLRLGGGEKQIGWSLTKDGECLDSYAMDAKDVTLYPVIESRTANYTVYYELEDAATGDFSVVDTNTVSAVSEIGNTVSADSIQSSELAGSYDGYRYSAADSTGEQTISDGSNIEIHVRFRAKKYQVTFDLNGNKNSVYDLSYSTLRMEVGDSFYTGKEYIAEVKTGEDFSAQWPTADNIVNNPYLAKQYSDYFQGWTDQNGTLYTEASQFMAALPELADADGNVVLLAKWEAPADSTDAPDATITYNIYLQNVNKDGYDLVESLDKTAKASALSKISLDPYAGFTYSHVEPVGEKKTISYGPWYAPTKVSYYEENDVYFDRNEYPLIFQSSEGTIRTESVAYDRELKEFADYEPSEKPAGRSYFEGWLDEDGVLFDFNAKMPMKSVTLTASWKYGDLETATLTYDANGGSGTSYSAGAIYELKEDATLYAIWEKEESPASNLTPEKSKDQVVLSKSESRGSDKKETKHTKHKESPETGDRADVQMHLALLAGSFAAGIGAMMARRKLK